MNELLIALLKATFEAQKYFGKVYGLVEIIKEGGKKYPAAYQSKDNYEAVTLEDSVIYFRKTGDISRRQEDEGVSGCDDMVFVTVPLVAVAHVPKSIFNTDNAYIDEKVSSNIANIIELAAWQQLKSVLKAEDIRCRVRRVKDNRNEVWAQEFEGIEMKARHDHVLCSVAFDIEVRITSSCLQNFECDDAEVTIDPGEIIVSVSDKNAWHKSGDHLTAVGELGSTNAFGFYIITDGTRQWFFDTSGNLIPQGNQTLGSQANPVSEIWVDTIHYNIPIPNVVQSINGLTDQHQFIVPGSAGTDFNIASAGDTHTINIPSASVLNRGLVTIGTQSFAGEKTHAGRQIFNPTYVATAANDYAWNFGGNLTAIAGQSFFNGALISPTINAAVNAQKMAAVVINPTFSLGAFTGTDQFSLYVVGHAVGNRGLVTGQHSDNTGGAILAYRKSRGNRLVPTTVANGDVIGQQLFQAYDGATWHTTGSILASIDGAVVANNVPTILRFLTGSQNGSLITGIRLNAQGNSFFGGDSNATATVEITAGTSSRAPLKLTSGASRTTPDNGSMEYNGTNLFFTRAGAVRETVFVGLSGAAAPATNAIGTITDYYGSSNSRVLTTPNSWASVVIAGVTYKIPLYT